MNTTTVYNHDIRYCSASGWEGWELYSGRALGISGHNDIVQVHPELIKLWPEITRHYENIGLTHSMNPVWDVSFSVFEEFPGSTISPFIFTDAVNLKSKEGVVLINWGTLLVGKLGILLAGNADKQAGIRDELLKRL